MKPGTALRNLRTSCDLSQADVCEAAKLSPTMLCLYERNRRPVDRKTTLRIVAAIYRLRDERRKAEAKADRDAWVEEAVAEAVSSGMMTNPFTGHQG